MSRIGQKPIPMKHGIEVVVDRGEVSVVGPLGSLSWNLNPGITVDVKSDELQVHRSGDSAPLRALHGLTRSELWNIVHGVSLGYERALELSGVGYRAQIQGQVLTLHVGFSHPVTVAIPQGIQVTVDKQTSIMIRGIDKRVVGQVAANIRRVRPPDVYKQKGIKYVGEVLIKKAGKAGKK